MPSPDMMVSLFAPTDQVSNMYPRDLPELVAILDITHVACMFVSPLQVICDQIYGLRGVCCAGRRCLHSLTQEVCAFPRPLLTLPCRRYEVYKYNPYLCGD